MLADHLLKKKIQKFKETGDSNYIYKNELDKSYFQHDIAYRDFIDLARRTAFDKIWRDKAFNITKNPKYYGYQRSLASMFTNLLIKSPQVVVLIRMPINLLLIMKY